MKLMARFFKDRDERTRWAGDQPTLPDKFDLLSLKEFQSESSSLTRKEGSCEGSSQCDLVALRCRVAPTARFWNFNQIPFRDAARQ